ncbi:zinc dependent phospholipase C family protein [Desulfonema magnum]|uniref:Phospholipase domain-containing protein n=1 Tax=Desulfonema magnum TaxID=45655 RepID=A0A975GPH9_9BACT|nr:zinc dependent phospholipase C family protein [Desulfonema magnum]QTA88872.1 Phospholipase domain-containing protein [Desulfonema magnum]
MPKEITHWMLAEKVCQNIDADSPLKNIINHHKNLYLAGAVIVDSPLYLLFGRAAKMMNLLGQKIHDNPEDSYKPVANLIHYYGQNVPDDVLSLLLGVISHIHADSLFHPLVYYVSGNNLTDQKTGRDQSMALHRILETYIDLYYADGFQLQNRGLVSQALNNAEMEKHRLLNVLAMLYSGLDGFQNLKDIRIPIKNALRSHALIQKLFDNNPLKIILRLLDAIPGADMEFCTSLLYPFHAPEPASIFRYPFSYRHPVTGEKFQHSVKDLEEKMIRETLHVFGLIEKHLKNYSPARAFSQLRGPNLCTGIPGTRASDMRYFCNKERMTELIFHMDCPPETYENSLAIHCRIHGDKKIL